MPAALSEKPARPALPHPPNLGKISATPRKKLSALALTYRKQSSGYNQHCPAPFSEWHPFKVLFLH
jgi:hypothetical protein